MRAALTLIGAVAMVVTSSLPAGALEGDFHTYTSDDYAELVATAWGVLPNLSEPLEPGPITGDPIDERIWQLAFSRGYQMTPLALNDSLVWRDGVRMQPQAADAWEGLQSAARTAGHRIVVTSALRTLDQQNSIFLSRLRGLSDIEIDDRLAYAAPPGASRHHTGYALDIKEEGSTIGRFATSEAYRWMSANNYYNAKKHGFIPSYPPDGPPQGPNPEAWEWLYVGVDTLAGDLRFIDVPLSHFASTSIGWMTDNGYTNGCDLYLFCPDNPATRGEIAVFMKRILEPTLGSEAPRSFDDTGGHPFESAIGWLGGHQITLGCDPPAFSMFCPDRPMTRGEMAAFFKRAVDHLIYSAEPLSLRFVDTTGSVFVNAIDWLAATGITTGCNPPENTEFCPDGHVTRAELAVFLKRISDRL